MKAKPIVITKPRTSARFCGACGKRIRFRDLVCKNCGCEVDWSDYDRRENENG